MLPVMARNLLESIRLLANVSPAARRPLHRRHRGRRRALPRATPSRSPSIVTPLNRYIGYEEAANVAKQALKENKTIREVVLERGLRRRRASSPSEQLDDALDVLSMTHP